MPAPIASVSKMDLVMIARETMTLGLPPVTCGMVPAEWTADGLVVPEFELEIWTHAESAELHEAVMYGGTLHALTFAAIELTADADSLIARGHRLRTGDGPVEVAGFAGDLWVIKIDDDRLAFADALDHALGGVHIPHVDIDPGAVAACEDTDRVYWTTHDGLLGLNGDGFVELGAQHAYRKRLPHSPRVIAYALVGEVSVPINAAIVAIQDG